MRGVAARARLIWGFSEGEFLCTALLLAVLIGVYMASILVIFPKVAVIEVLGLATRNKVYWAEAWAVDGPRAFAHKPIFDDEVQGKYAASVDTDSLDAGLTFEFNARMPALTEGLITIRPAFSAGEDSYSVIWLCAQAPVPAGFTVHARDFTDLPDTVLNASCRSRSR
jgi:hypothetical protein